MQLSDSGDTLYVSNLQTGTISVINIATGNFTEIDVGLQTFAFAVGGGKLYAGRLINDLQVVDLATRNQTNVKTGDQGVFAAVMDIALAPGFAYVTDPLANKLVVVDRSNNTVVDRLDVGAGPSSVAVSSDGDFVFVANAQDGSVSVIDTARALVALTFPVGTNPTQLDLSADGKTLYVTTNAGVKVIPTADIYLVTGSGGDGPGWDVGAGTGIDTDPIDPTLPTLPGGGLGGGGSHHAADPRRSCYRRPRDGHRLTTKT